MPPFKNLLSAKEIAHRLRLVPTEFLPTPYQYTLWHDFVMWRDGTDPNGNFQGWCPLHDPTRVDHEQGAEFNFDRGVMRCYGDCHAGKRAMSLSNVKTRMSDGD